jgi:diguanylate cyclase (GGDEF)-like protein
MVDLWNNSPLKTLLIPGGLLLAFAVTGLHTGLLTLALPGLSFVYYSALVAGLLLSWRFHSSRVFFALVVVLLSQEAVAIFSAGHYSVAGPGRTVIQAVGLLLPVNFVGFSLMRERGFVSANVAPVLLVLFMQAVAVGVVCRSSEELSSAERVAHHGSPILLANYVVLAFSVAAAILLVRFLLLRRAVDSGLLWSLAACFLALYFGARGRIAIAYFAVSAVILTTSIIETSYFLAYHDELTTLPSRRAFNDALLRLQKPYSIAMVDIDHFKKFNDKHGHETGDQVLRLVASNLARVTGGGRAYRCGGEEFAIIFPGKSTDDIIDHLEALRSTIETARFRIRQTERRQIPRGPDRRNESTRERTQRNPSLRRMVLQAHDPEMLSVTVSIGVATARAEASDTDQVIQAADKALYRAKASGRNRVETSVPPRRRRARTTEIA